MRILRMKWNRLLSYGDNNEIDFTKSTLSQIVGKNGFGKSSIVHILEEFLYGKNSKGYKKADIPNRYFASKNYSGAVHFEKNNDIYVLQIHRTGATQKVSLLKNTTDISQHTATATYDLVEKILGKDFKLFTQLIYQNSRSSLHFLTSTDTVRKKFLIDLLNLNKYTDTYEKLKTIIKDLTADINKLEGELNYLETWIKSQSNKSIEVIELKNVPDSQEINILKEQLKNKQYLLNNVEQQNIKIEKNNEYKKQRLKIDANLLTNLVEKLDTKTHITKISELEHNIKAQKDLLNKVKCLDNRCPTCTQTVDKNFIDSLVATAEASIGIYKHELDKYNKEYADIIANNKKHEITKKAIEDFEKYSNLIDKDLENVLHDRNKLSTEINSIEQQINEISNTIKECYEYNNAAIANNAKVKMLKEQLDSSLVKVNKVKNSLNESNNTIQKLEVLKKTFSTNGLVAYKLEHSVKELENLTNTYLLELSDGRFQIHYQVVNDKLNIVVKDHNKDIEIEALSSGELSRVTTATLLAIRKLLNSLSNDTINLLFLDEVIDVLDEEGKDKLIDLLLKETELNTFIVSHGYTHPLLSKIVIDKINNISKIIND